MPRNSDVVKSYLHRYTSSGQVQIFSSLIAFLVNFRFAKKTQNIFESKWKNIKLLRKKSKSHLLCFTNIYLKCFSITHFFFLINLPRKKRAKHIYYISLTFVQNIPISPIFFYFFQIYLVFVSSIAN
jgi:hypothetical protein